MRSIKQLARAAKIFAAVLIALMLTGEFELLSAQSAAESLIVKQLRRTYADEPSEVRYFLKFFDLNGDGKPEAIVHIVGSNVCGTGGCETLIFTPEGDDYKLLADISITRPEIIASPRRTRGWRNLIVYVAGGGLSGRYVELKFDGKSYPENPTDEVVKRVRGNPRGAVLIPDFNDLKEGKLLIAGESQ